MTENADVENEESALRPAESDLHPADPADDLTGNKPGDSADSSGAPAPDGPAPDAALPGDSVPGDGAVEHDRPDVPDAMRTATTGREAATARADTSDDKPTPTATPAD